MRIKKVKLTNEKKVSIIYEKPNKIGGYDEYSMTCLETARPEFYKAFEALAPEVVDMCELPDEYLPRIKVRGVSFSYGGEKEIMGATISASMELRRSYPRLNINTPHKASAMYSEGTPDDDMQLLSADCIETMDALQAECRAYIKGERAQAKLFGGEAA